ncbi:MAG: hypothetical protein AVDCRST_MAG18-2242 [uncultured Thermomicrobiales bacterium]|uniref:Uncharacterized protein n=1 Tax=uncultured Thermomicrobiales bacterium TaxID=1645740 RepID=A0A6J4VA51_9BACT|nr:MAG: hypothetical protein AVDCRST_MAG18-2242 [uncultured Thermomicrobiales bacterium]
MALGGGEATLILIAIFVAVGLLCVLRPPERLLRRLGVPIEPTKEERQLAEGRANLLLRQLLGDEEYERVVLRGYLELASPSIPGRLYRVPAVQGMVDVIEEGVATMRLCVVPTRWVPDPDVMIMHKLLIEGDEARYLRVANRFPAGASRLIVPPWWERGRGAESN